MLVECLLYSITLHFIKLSFIVTKAPRFLFFVFCFPLRLTPKIISSWGKKYDKSKPTKCIYTKGKIRNCNVILIRRWAEHEFWNWLKLTTEIFEYLYSNCGESICYRLILYSVVLVAVCGAGMDWCSWYDSLYKTSLNFVKISERLCGCEQSFFSEIE